MLRKALLPTFNSIPASTVAGTAIVDLPIGLRYHSIWLELGGVDAGNANAGIAFGTAFGDIRVKINGKVQRTHSATELNVINAINGTPYAAKTKGTLFNYRTYLPIFFAEPWRKDIREQQMPAWNVNGVRSFQIEVDVLAGVTTPVIAGWYEYEPATGTLGTISKVIRHTFPAVGTQADFNTLDRQDFIQAIHLFKPTDTKCVTKVRLTANNNTVQDLLDTQQNMAALLARELTPATGVDNPRFDLIFDADDPLNGALNANGLAELTLHVEFGTYTTATGAYGAAPGTSGSMTALLVRAGAPE